MTETCDLLRLLTWLSPSFPVGAFSYSQGLEWVVERGLVRDRGSLRDWIEDVLEHGSGRNDAILLAEAWRATTGADWPRLREAAELALALTPTGERMLETEAQGVAFLNAAEAGWPKIAAPLRSRLPDAPYPVAVGAVAAAGRVALEATLLAYLHATTANLISAGLRLIPLGQSDGVRTQADLEQQLRDIARRAIASGLDGLGGFAFAADIASLSHETQHTRLFRS